MYVHSECKAKQNTHSTYMSKSEQQECSLIIKICVRCEHSDAQISFSHLKWEFQRLTVFFFSVINLTTKMLADWKRTTREQKKNGVQTASCINTMHRIGKNMWKAYDTEIRRERTFRPLHTLWTNGKTKRNGAESCWEAAGGPRTKWRMCCKWS